MGPILKVKNLSKHFDVSPPLITRLVSREEKSILKAVEGIGFEIKQGETVSLVGESGCGKSTVARLVVKLYEPTNGEIFFGNQNFSSREYDEKIHAQVAHMGTYANPSIWQADS